MKIVILGGGKMSHAITTDLARQMPDAELVVADSVLKNAKAVQQRAGGKVKAVTVDVADGKKLARLLDGASAVVGATSYAHNVLLTKACIAAGASFCDLGGNVDVVSAQLALSAKAEKAGVTVIPDCGLAPGMANIVAYHWAQDFSKLDRLHIRVGGLPAQPANELRYASFFAVEGLINEYVEDGVVLERGKPKKVAGMTGFERLSFAAPLNDLEAFYTSGGTSSLPRLLEGKVQTLDYKTIRYPGHGHVMKVMLDAGFFSSKAVDVVGKKVVPRAVAGKLLSTYLPHNPPDVVLVRVHLVGERNGRRTSIAYDCVDHFDSAAGLSAMQRTTGFPVAIVAGMLARNEIGRRGVIPQEAAVPGKRFLEELGKRNIRFDERELAE
jgi:lysine 6-dehydrogenase